MAQCRLDNPRPLSSALLSRLCSEIVGAEPGNEEFVTSTYRPLLDHGLETAEASTLIDIGSQLFGMGHIGDATRAYRLAVSRDASDVTARVNLGWTLYLGEQYDESIEQYRQALERGRNSHAQFNLALTYLAKGETERADKLYGEAVGRYGRDVAHDIGAIEELRRLMERGLQVSATESILQKHFAER